MSEQTDVRLRCQTCREYRPADAYELDAYECAECQEVHA